MSDSELRSVGPADILRDSALGSALLALNNAHAQELSWLEPERLVHLVSQAFVACRIGSVDAFLLAFELRRNHDPTWHFGIIIAVFLVLMGYSFTLTLFLNKFATLIHIFFQSAGLLFLLIESTETITVLGRDVEGGARFTATGSGPSTVIQVLRAALEP